MTIAASKQSLRPIFRPLFALQEPPVPQPADLDTAATADPPIPSAEHRRLVAAAESVAYERGVADGLRETSATHLAKAREHFRETSDQLKELMAAVERRGLQQDSAIDQALRLLASRLALGDDRRTLYALFARYVTAYSARIRAGDVLSFRISASALQYLETNAAEFLTSLQTAGVTIKTGDGEALAIFESSREERAVIDFDSLTEDIRAAFGGEVQSARKGGVNE